MARPIWDGWHEAATSATARSRRAGIALSAVVALAAVFAVVASSRDRLAIALYSLPLVLAIYWLTRTRMTHRRLRSTVKSMRVVLAGNEISQFEQHVLITALTNSRVPAQRESRLLLIDVSEEVVTLSAVEYDMSQIEPTTYGVGGG